MNTVIVPLTKGLYISEYYRERNFINSEVLFVGRFKGKGDIYRSLVYFDIEYLNEIIPPYSLIQSACLKMHIVRNDLLDGQKAKICVYPVIKPWRDDGVKWNDQPEFDKKEEFALMVKDGLYGGIDFDITVLAKDWYEKKRPNYGMIICGEEGCDALIALGGLSFQEVCKKPVLIISYSSFDYYK